MRLPAIYIVFASIIGTNGAWQSYVSDVLLQELTKILENHEECSE